MNLMIDDVIYAYDDIFSSFGTITTKAGKTITRSDLIKYKIEVLIVRSRTQVDENLLKNTAVKFVGSAVSGKDHIDLNYLKKNKIAFAHAGGSNANAVAQYVISALVNLADDKNFDLSDKTLGIIGVGHVGEILNKKAQLFGLKTLLHDPPRQTIENLPHFVDLKTALSADIISFHTPLTKPNVSGSVACIEYPSYHLLNADNAHLIKKDAIIINTARGGVIDEVVWQTLPVLANVIDCWENEPNINHNLKQTAYWASPHIAGHSIDAKFMGSYMIYTQLCKWLKKPIDTHLKNLIKPNLKPLKTTTLKNTLNAIYDFTQDRTCLESANAFEDYRRYYPKRYEWQHFYHPLLKNSKPCE